MVTKVEHWEAVARCLFAILSCPQIVSFVVIIPKYRLEFMC